MNKTVLIWLGVFAIMCFVIYLPIMEENYHINQDPHYLDGKYELTNGFTSQTDTIKIKTN